MKLRIKGNSIRLRLLRSEVDRFTADGRISEDVDFGGSVLRYSLRMSDETDWIKAEFENNVIEVVIPETLARGWAGSDSVGLETEQAVGGGKNLAILIEKDFVCLDRPNDPDRDDAFANPSLKCEPV